MRTRQQRKYCELIGGELGRDSAALIVGWCGKSFCWLLDLEELACQHVRERLHNSTRPANFNGRGLAFGTRTDMRARISQRQTPLARHYRLQNPPKQASYSTTEIRGSPENTDPAPGRLRNKEFPSSQGVHSTFVGWADGCGSTASSAHPVEFNSSKDLVSPWAKARTISAASCALSRLPARA